VLEREAALVARQIMSRPLISLEEGVSTAKAWELVLERRFRHVPVRTEGGRITGILSDRDLLRWQARSEGSEIPIREIMTTPVLVAHPDAEIRLVARVLFEEHIGAMPIIDEQSIPVGILTRSDILRAVIQRAPLHLWI
jgi:acetoin utilization protein AcuB